MEIDLSLLGCQEDDEKWIQFLENLPVDKTEILRKAYRECFYIVVIKLGLEFCFDETKGGKHTLAGIHVFAETKRYRRCPLKLPRGLSLTMTIQGVVEALGQPTQKSGGGISPISLSYDKIGTQFEFLGTQWNDKDNPVTSIVFY
eukprot:GHVO01016866.1.p2 GENE.GHVO01016866.1~~GHVO01016866.1.p2  ORF type:complete len:145 (+),score=35.98 GHVO01016866.1:793-1227(+)